MAEKKQEPRTTAARTEERDATTTAAARGSAAFFTTRYALLPPYATGTATMDHEVEQQKVPCIAMTASLGTAGTPHTKKLTPHARPCLIILLCIAASHYHGIRNTSERLLHSVAVFCIICVAAACAALAGAVSSIGRAALRRGHELLAAAVAGCDYASAALLFKILRLLQCGSREPVFLLPLPYSAARTASLYSSSFDAACTPCSSLASANSINDCRAVRRSIESNAPRTTRRALHLSVLPLFFLSFICCAQASSTPSQPLAGQFPGAPYVPDGCVVPQKPPLVPFGASAWASPTTLPASAAAVVSRTPSEGSVTLPGGPQYVYSARRRRPTHYAHGSPLRARTLLQQQQQQRVALLQHSVTAAEEKRALGFGTPIAGSPASLGAAHAFPYGGTSPATVSVSYPRQPAHVVDRLVHVRPGGTAAFAPVITDPYECPSPTVLAPVACGPTGYPVGNAVRQRSRGVPVSRECFDCEAPVPAVVTAHLPYHSYAVPPPGPISYATPGWPQRGASRTPQCDIDHLRASPRVHMSGRIIHRHPSAPDNPAGRSAAWIPAGRGGSGTPGVPVPASPVPRQSTRAPSRPPASLHIVDSSASVAVSARRRPTVPPPGSVARASAPWVAPPHLSSVRRGTSLAPAVLTPAPEAAPWAYRTSSFAYRVAGPQPPRREWIRIRRGPLSAHAVFSPAFTPKHVAFMHPLGGPPRASRPALPAAVSYREIGEYGEEGNGEHSDEEKKRAREGEPEQRKRKKKEDKHLERGGNQEEADERWGGDEADQDEEEEEEPEEQEEQEEEEAPEEEEDEEEQARVRDKMRRESKELLQQQPKLLEWDYRKRGEDWAIGRGGCASHTRQSPINFDEQQRPLSMEEAGELEEHRKEQERRRTRNEEAAATARKRKGRSAVTSYRAASRAKTMPLVPPNLLIDAKEDETKFLQLRLGTDIQRYIVDLEPRKKVEFEPQKYNALGDTTSRKRRELISSFGFVRTAGKIYDVMNFHFHSPAEHTFNMRRRALELHIVCEHTASDLLVIGVTFEGVKNSAVGKGASTADALRGDTSMLEHWEGTEEDVTASTHNRGADRKRAAAAMKGLKKGAAAAGGRQEGEADFALAKEQMAASREKAGEADATKTGAKEGVTGRNKKRDFKGAQGKNVVSPAAQEFLAAVAEAIRLTQAAAPELVDERSVGAEAVVEGATLGKGERVISAGKAGASKRQLRAQEVEPEEEEEPFGRTQKAGGAPWVFSRHVGTHPEKSFRRWGSWADFEGSTTTASSQESLTASQKDLLFPLLRTLPPTPLPAEAEQPHRHRRKKKRDDTKVEEAREREEEEEEAVRGAAAEALRQEAKEEKAGKKSFPSGFAPERKQIKEKPRRATKRKRLLFAGIKEQELPVFNLQALLSDKSRIFYRYNGSLTTPPCSETVLWYVLKEPLYVEANLLKAVQSVLQPPGQGLQGTYRVLQNVEGRDNNRENVYIVKSIS